MPLIQNYTADALPTPHKYQMLAYLRAAWPDVFTGGTRLWDYTQKTTNPAYFMAVEEDILLGFCEINWRLVRVESKSIKLWGLSAVYVAPPYRGEGIGGRLVERASNQLRAQDAAMLFCEDDFTGFYDAHGWRTYPLDMVIYGDATAPSTPDNQPMLLEGTMYSGAIQQLQRPLYIGDTTW